MSIKSLFTKKKKSSYEFTDEDRELSNEIRKQRAEIRKEKAKYELEKERLRNQIEIEELKSQLEELKGIGDEEEQSIEQTLLNSILTPLIQKQFNPMDSLKMASSSSYSAPANREEEVHFSDDEIKGMIHQFDRATLKYARKMDDEQLRTVIIDRVPNIDADSVNRAILLIKQ